MSTGLERSGGSLVIGELIVVASVWEEGAEKGSSGFEYGGVRRGVGKGGWARFEVCKFIGGFNIRAFKL